MPFTRHCSLNFTHWSSYLYSIKQSVEWKPCSSIFISLWSDQEYKCIAEFYHLSFSKPLTVDETESVAPPSTSSRPPQPVRQPGLQPGNLPGESRKRRNPVGWRQGLPTPLSKPEGKTAGGRSQGAEAQRVFAVARLAPEMWTGPEVCCGKDVN